MRFVSFVAARRILRRVVFSFALLYAIATFFPRESFAQTDDRYVEAHAINLPAHITPRAKSGLFTAVALAGNRLVAVGELGRIIVSDDNGISWRQVPSPTSVTLTHVAFSTEKNGWAAGNMGVVLYSDNGGLSWSKKLDGVQAANIALQAANLDIHTSGTNDVTTANLQSAQALVAGGPSVPFLDIYTATDNSVIVAGAFGMVFSSSDAGTTWHSLMDFMPDPNGLHIYEVLKDGDNFAVVGEQGMLLYGPPDRPLAMMTSNFQGTFFGEVFAPDRSWLVFGLQGTILRSTTQGKQWTNVSAGQAVGIDCGIVLKMGEIVLGNEAGQLLASRDNGKTYSVVAVNEPIIGLAQAVDGALIAVGPTGPRRIMPSQLTAGG